MAENDRAPRLRFKGFTEDWKQCRFSDEVIITHGLTYSPSDVVKDGVRVLRSSNIEDDTFIYGDDDVFVSSDCVNIDYAGNGDILITSANGSSRLVGKHAVISGINDDSAVHGGFMLLARTKRPYFINASMSSSWYRDFIDTYVAGGNGAIGNLSKSDLENQIFLIPCDDEQNKIAELFEEINSLIICNQRKHDRLCETKKSLLDNMFPTDGEATPRIRFREYTDDWKQHKLGECFSERQERSAEGELISVTINEGIKKFSELGKYDNSSEDKSHYKKVEPGDIAYNSMRMWQGASGVSRYSGILSPAYTVLVPDDGVDSLFFSFVFKRPDVIHTFKISSQGITSDNWNLKYPALSEIECSMPSFDEQGRIAEFLNKLDNLIALQKQKVDKLKDMKSALLEKMFV